MCKLEANELYNCCLAETIVISNEEEGILSSYWTEIINSDLEEKFLELNEKDQDKFEKKLRKIALKYKNDFDSLHSINRADEIYEETENRLIYSISDEMKEFLIE